MWLRCISVLIVSELHAPPHLCELGLKVFSRYHNHFHAPSLITVCGVSTVKIRPSHIDNAGLVLTVLILIPGTALHPSGMLRMVSFGLFAEECCTGVIWLICLSSEHSTAMRDLSTQVCHLFKFGFVMILVPR